LELVITVVVGGIFLTLLFQTLSKSFKDQMVMGNTSQILIHLSQMEYSLRKIMMNGDVCRASLSGNVIDPTVGVLTSLVIREPDSPNPMASPDMRFGSNTSAQMTSVTLKVLSQSTDRLTSEILYRGEVEIKMDPDPSGLALLQSSRLVKKIFPIAFYLDAANQVATCFGAISPEAFAELMCNAYGGTYTGSQTPPCAMNTLYVNPPDPRPGLNGVLLKVGGTTEVRGGLKLGTATVTRKGRISFAP